MQKKIIKIPLMLIKGSGFIQVPPTPLFFEKPMNLATPEMILWWLADVLLPSNENLTLSLSVS